MSNLSREPLVSEARNPAAGKPLAAISDVHIHARPIKGGELVLDLAGSLLFPGPRRVVTGDETQMVRTLFDLVSVVERREFSVRVESPFEAIYRVQRVDVAVDGVWFRMRSTSLAVPTLSTLPSRLPAHIEQMILSENLSSGGLILVAGQPGSGKTTTASAILASRLMQLGGFGYTIEDPPEILGLNGWHGTGYCTQTEVYRGSNGWEDSIKDLLRSQPVGSRLVLYVSEIRSPETAKMIIRAASNGFLVITTTFATDILSSIDTLYQMLGQDYISSLSSVLRVVLYQRFRAGLTPEDRRIEAQALYSDGSSSRMAISIRSRQLSQLKDELVYQTNQVRSQARSSAQNQLSQLAGAEA